LAAIPLAAKISFTRDVIAAGRAIDAGVVEATTRTREKYWRHWCRYTSSIEVDPLLRSTDPLIRDVVITAFAARVRTGHYGRGSQIRFQGVTDALSAISKTIELAGYKSPVYRAPNVYNLQIQRCIEGYKREDPPAVPQLALPVSVPTHMATVAYEPSQQDSNTHQQAIADLAIMAFYYLLRVGEYTAPRTVMKHGIRVRATRTVQFTVGNIGFHHQNKIVPRASQLETLLQADQ
jgi:hypothetical protein